MTREEPRPDLHVLVIDDSAVVRQALTAMLSAEPGFTVAVAADPLFALEKMKTRRPDVIVLDLMMPRMDGLTFLKQLMATDPLPVIVCSEVAAQGAELALSALCEGAVEIVTKPRLGVQEFLRDSAVAFVDAVRAAAQVRPRSRRVPRLVERVERRVLAPPAGLSSVIALGASTGGTEAIGALLRELPSSAPGVVIVQHMPEKFTAAFAKQLDRQGAVRVKEAADGDRLQPGLALVAPGNRHLQLRGGSGNYYVQVSDGPLVSRHRPSVDVLFESVAEVAGRDAVGVVMTGMGDDGARGLLAMKQAGARTFAQDEASCVVFGMPQAAIARGAVDAVVSLDRLASAVLSVARTRDTPPPPSRLRPPRVP